MGAQLDRLPEQLHQLEQEFELPAHEILEVINRRNRCKIAVRGAIAEYHLLRHLHELQQAKAIDSFEDFDVDGHPDFQVVYAGRPFLVECKMVEKMKGAREAITIDFQRTRNQKEGPEKRFYEPGEFEVVAACLWNRTRRWEFRFAPTAKLTPHPRYPGRLSNRQVVSPGETEVWTSSLPKLLERLVAG